MTAPLADVAPRPRLQLRPAPAADPPYDDELPGGPSRQRGLWLVPLPADQLPFDDPPPVPEPPVTDFDTQPTPRSALPCPKKAAAGLVQAVLEVFAGRRPLQQLMPVTTERVYDELRYELSRQRAGRIRRGLPLPNPARVRSVHVGEPADGVAEATAVVRQGDRHRAVALRLEGADGRWHCTALRLL